MTLSPLSSLFAVATLDGFPFPVVNASLNGISATLLLAGFVFIKMNAVRAHIIAMLSAVVTSTAFLACYIIYHAHRAANGIGVTEFPRGTQWRSIYLAILVSHTILAIVILPLIATTLLHAYRKRWHAHKKLAVVTFPLWFYVSVTGVVIYWMLYRFAPTLAGK
jgi:uncharacterized membrane protein YozB (DUF420 family)